LTSTTLASPSVVRSQPDAVSRAASSSESTSLRAQPRGTRLTVRGAEGPDSGRGDTTRAYLRLLAHRLRAEAQRHRVEGVGGLLLAVHGEHDTRRVAQADLHGLHLGPGLGVPGRHHAHVDLGAVGAAGELDPAVLAGGQRDD